MRPLLRLNTETSDLGLAFPAVGAEELEEGVLEERERRLLMFRTDSFEKCRLPSMAPPFVVHMRSVSFRRSLRVSIALRKSQPRVIDDEEEEEDGMEDDEGEGVWNERYGAERGRERGAGERRASTRAPSFSVRSTIKSKRRM